MCSYYYLGLHHLKLSQYISPVSQPWLYLSWLCLDFGSIVVFPSKFNIKEFLIYMEQTPADVPWASGVQEEQ